MDPSALSPEQKEYYDFLIERGLTEQAEALLQPAPELTGPRPAQLPPPPQITPTPQEPIEFTTPPTMTDEEIKAAYERLKPPVQTEQERERGIGLGPAPLKGYTGIQERLLEQRRFVTPETLQITQEAAFADALDYAGSQLGLLYEGSTAGRKGLRQEALEQYGQPEITSPETPEQMTAFRAQEKFIEDYIKDIVGPNGLTAEQFAFERVYGRLSPRQPRPGGFRPEPTRIQPSEVDLLRYPERATGMGGAAIIEALKPQIVEPGPKVRQVREEAQRIRKDALEGVEQYKNELMRPSGERTFAYDEDFAETQGAIDYFTAIKTARATQIRREVDKAEARGGIAPTDIASQYESIEPASIILTREMIETTYPKSLDAQNPRNKEMREKLLSNPQFGGGNDFYEQNSYFSAIGDVFTDAMTNQPNERLRTDLIDAGIVKDPDAITESQLSQILRGIGMIGRGLVTKPISDLANSIPNITPDMETIGLGIAAAAPQLAYELGRGLLGEEMVGRTAIEPSLTREEIEKKLEQVPPTPFSVGLGERISVEEEDQQLKEMGMFPYGRRYESPTPFLGGYLEELAVETASGRTLGNDVIATKRFEGSGLDPLTGFIGGTVAELFVPLTPFGALSRAGKTIQSAAKSRGAYAAGLFVEGLGAPFSAAKKIRARGIGGAKIQDEINKTLLAASRAVDPEFKPLADALDSESLFDGVVGTVATVNEKMVDITGDIINGLAIASRGMKMPAAELELMRVQGGFSALAENVAFQFASNPKEALAALNKIKQSSSTLAKGVDVAMAEIVPVPSSGRMGAGVFDRVKSAISFDIATKVPDDYIMLTPRMIVSKAWMANPDNQAAIIERMQEINKFYEFKPSVNSYVYVKGSGIPKGLPRVLSPKDFEDLIANNLEQIAIKSASNARVPEEYGVAAKRALEIIETPVERRPFVSVQVMMSGLKSLWKNQSENSGLVKIVSSGIKTLTGQSGKANITRFNREVELFKKEVDNIDGALRRNVMEDLKNLRGQYESTDEVIQAFVINGILDMPVDIPDVMLKGKFYESVEGRPGILTPTIKNAYMEIVTRKFGGAITRHPNFESLFNTAFKGARGDFSIEDIDALSRSIMAGAPGIGEFQRKTIDIMLEFGVDATRTREITNAASRTISMTDFGTTRMFYASNNAFPTVKMATAADTEQELIRLGRKFVDDYATQVILKGPMPDEDFVRFFTEFNVKNGIDLPAPGQAATPFLFKPMGEDLARRIKAGGLIDRISPEDLAATISSYYVRIGGNVAIMPPGILDPELLEILQNPRAFTNLSKNLQDSGIQMVARQISEYFYAASKGSWVQGQLGGKFVPNFAYQISNIVSQPIMAFITNPSYAITVAGEMFRPGINRIRASRAALEAPNAPSKVPNVTNRQLYDMLRRYNLGATGERFGMADAMLKDMKAQAQGFKQLMSQKKLSKEAKLLAKRTFDYVSGTRTSPWSKVASEVDYSFREGVFIEALRRGNSPETAARLARETLFDYGSLPKWLKDGIGSFAMYVTFMGVSMAEIIKALFRPNGALQVSKLAQAHTAVSNMFPEYKGNDEELLSKILLYPSFFDPSRDKAQPINTYFNDPYIGNIKLASDIVMRGIAASNETEYQDKILKATTGTFEAVYNALYLPLFELRDELKELDYKKAVPAKSTEVLRLLEQTVFEPGTMMDFFDLEIVGLDDYRPGRPEYDTRQYRFRSDEGRRRFVLYTTAMTALGANRMLNDIVGARIAAGMLPPDAQFGYLTQDPRTYGFTTDSNGSKLVRGGLYLFGGERPIRAPQSIERSQAQLQMNQRELRDLMQTFK